MPFDLLTVLPTRTDVVEVNGFNGAIVLNGVPSAYHWYTRTVWREVAFNGYDLNISSQETSIQIGFRHAWWCQPESDVVAALSRRFGCTLETLVRRTGLQFLCGWQL